MTLSSNTNSCVNFGFVLIDCFHCSFRPFANLVTFYPLGSWLLLYFHTYFCLLFWWLRQ